MFPSGASRAGHPRGQRFPARGWRGGAGLGCVGNGRAKGEWGAYKSGVARVWRVSVAKTGRPLANRTLVVRMKAVKALFSFLTREGTVLRDPTSDVASPREQVILSRNVLLQDEVRELIQRTRPVDPLSMRNRAIAELFYACGGCGPRSSAT